MTLEEAIEVLGLLYRINCRACDICQRNALALGIEALKRVQKDRTFPYTLPLPLLPGETLD